MMGHTSTEAQSAVSVSYGYCNQVPSVVSTNLLSSCSGGQKSKIKVLAGPWGFRSERASRVPWNKLGSTGSPGEVNEMAIIREGFPEEVRSELETGWVGEMYVGWGRGYQA